MAEKHARRSWVMVNRAAALALWAGLVAEVLGFEHDEALTLGRAEPVCPDEPQKRLTSLAQWLKAHPRHLHPENPPNPR